MWLDLACANLAFRLVIVFHESRKTLTRLVAFNKGILSRITTRPSKALHDDFIQGD